MDCSTVRRTLMLVSAHAAISRRPTTASTALVCTCTHAADCLFYRDACTPLLSHNPNHCLDMVQAWGRPVLISTGILTNHMHHNWTQFFKRCGKAPEDTGQGKHLQVRSGARPKKKCS